MDTEIKIPNKENKSSDNIAGLELKSKIQKTENKPTDQITRLPDNNPSPVLRIAKDGTILYVNTASNPLLGKSGAKPGDLAPTIFLIIAKKVLISKRVEHDLEIKASNKIFSFTCVPMLKRNYVNFYGQDITTLKKAEEEIKRFKIFSNYSNDAHYLVGRDARFQYVNTTACQAMGYSEKELLNLHVYDVDLMYDIEKFQKLFDQIQEEKIKPFESINKRKDGTTYPVEISTTGIQYNGEKFMFAVIRDISERKEAENALRKSEEKFKNIFEKSPIGNAIVAPSGQFIEVNDTLSNMLGYKREELVQKSFMDITHPKDLNNDIEAKKEMILGIIDSYKAEKRYIHKDGHIIWIKLNTTIIRDGNNKPQYFLTKVQDITDAKIAKEALKRSEEKYKILAESSKDIIFIVDKAWIIKYINRSGADAFGVDPTDLINKKIDAIYKLTNKNRQYFNIVFDTSKSLYTENRALIKNEWHYFDTLLMPIGNKNSLQIMGISRDITEIRNYLDASEAINNINAILASSYNLEDVLQDTLKEIARTINCDTVSMSIKEDKETWQNICSYGLLNQMAKNITGARFQDNDLKKSFRLTYDAVQSREIIIINDSSKDARTKSLFEKFKVKSIAVAPLYAHNKLYGCLYFMYHTKAIEFDVQKVDFISKILTPLAFALQNHRHYKTQKEYVKRINDAKILSDNLNQINNSIHSTLNSDIIMQNVLTKAANAIGCESAAIMLINKGKWLAKYVYGALAPFQGEELSENMIIATAKASKNNELIYSNDAFNDKRLNTEQIKEKNIRSFLAIPLRTRDQIVGTFILIFHSKTHEFSDSEVDFGRNLGTSISLALENAHLHYSYRKN